MIQRTETEIKEKVTEIWCENGGKWPDMPDTIDVDLSADRILIEISAMYSSPGLNAGHLIALCEFFGTTNINDDETFNEEGCETCDYGSKYGFTLTVREQKQ